MSPVHLPPANTRPRVRTIREEVFGPHVALIPFDDDDEAIRIYNDTPYGLSMAVITEDYRRWRYYRDECDYGMGYVNLPCIGAEVHLPFGGVKRSGNGQPSAAGLVDAVTHKTAFTVNHDRGITMAQGMSAKIRRRVDLRGFETCRRISIRAASLATRASFECAGACMSTYPMVPTVDPCRCRSTLPRPACRIW